MFTTTALISGKHFEIQAEPMTPQSNKPRIYEVKLINDKQKTDVFQLFYDHQDLMDVAYEEIEEDFQKWLKEQEKQYNDIQLDQR